jgi:hypothetical protein
MAAQIKIATVGVPNEKNTGINLDVVTSADPVRPKVDKISLSETRAMTSNNMPEGRKP